jgi:hypothetical protein
MNAQPVSGKPQARPARNIQRSKAKFSERTSTQFLEQA